MRIDSIATGGGRSRAGGHAAEGGPRGRTEAVEVSGGDERGSKEGERGRFAEDQNQAPTSHF